MIKALLFFILALFWSNAVLAATSVSHHDPFSSILLIFTLVLLLAGVGRWAAGLFSQPGVLGELLVGVIAGNVAYHAHRPLAVLFMNLDAITRVLRYKWNHSVSVSQAVEAVFDKNALLPGGPGHEVMAALTGPSAPDFLAAGAALWFFSSLGLILLLFLAGLENSIKDIMVVGNKAMRVAVTGVILPFAFGYVTGALLMPEAGAPVHLFLGATLCATSVGITARTFKDLDALHSPEARVILGAAVIDDILGLIVLAVVSGIVATGTLHLGEALRITTLSVLFLGSTIVFGDRLLRWLIPYLKHFIGRHLKLLFPLSFAFIMAWLADLIGLASIVGAFAAGLILCDYHFDEHVDDPSGLAEMIAPLETLFAPVFFVVMGLQVNLATFLRADTLVLAVAFTIAAVIGKILAGAVAGPKINRLSVGLGMVPRGEVGLIFASVGKSLGVVSEGIFSAIVVMVIVTTLITPPLLKWSRKRGRPPKESL